MRVPFDEQAYSVTFRHYTVDRFLEGLTLTYAPKAKKLKPHRYVNYQSQPPLTILGKFLRTSKNPQSKATIKFITKLFNFKEGTSCTIRLNKLELVHVFVPLNPGKDVFSKDAGRRISLGRALKQLFPDSRATRHLFKKALETEVNNQRHRQQQQKLEANWPKSPEQEELFLDEITNSRLPEKTKSEIIEEYAKQNGIEVHNIKMQSHNGMPDLRGLPRVVDKTLL